jgi:hypothetical protein
MDVSSHWAERRAVSRRAFIALAPSRTTPDRSSVATDRGFHRETSHLGLAGISRFRFPLSLQAFSGNGKGRSAKAVPTARFGDRVSACRATTCRFHAIRGTRTPFHHHACSESWGSSIEKSAHAHAQAVSWAAQTALRDIIGRTTLTDLLRGRERIEDELQHLIDQRSNPWGVTVSSVEMRDVVIPGALQDAMSREAQAAREKQARIILGQAEVEIAKSFQEAAKSYHDDPTALHLRAMNMLYEGLKEKGALMLIPSSAVESMGMGGMLGAAALRQKTLAGKSEPTKSE